jgi:putative tryptophan/tyrosine transport system substrate-binding protein
VFSIGGDPVRLGLVASLNRPGGNLTGIFFSLNSEQSGLGCCMSCCPSPGAIGMLVNPTFADAETHAKDVKEAALPLGVQIHVVRARTVDDFDAAFATWPNKRSTHFSLRMMHFSMGRDES